MGFFDLDDEYTKGQKDGSRGDPPLGGFSKEYNDGWENGKYNHDVKEYGEGLAKFDRWLRGAEKEEDKRGSDRDSGAERENTNNSRGNDSDFSSVSHVYSHSENRIEKIVFSERRLFLSSMASCVGSSLFWTLMYQIVEKHIWGEESGISALFALLLSIGLIIAFAGMCLIGSNSKRVLLILAVFLFLPMTVGLGVSSPQYIPPTIEAIGGTSLIVFSIILLAKSFSKKISSEQD